MPVIRDKTTDDILAENGRLRSALENFADEKNWSDRPGCLQWMGKRHAIEYARSELSDITTEDRPCRS